MDYSQDWLCLMPDRASSVARAYEQRQLHFACKRLCDILVSGILLLVLLPLMLVIAILIVLDTPGPAIFKQERLGLRRRAEGNRATWEVGTFPFFKFRTMRRDTAADTHRAFVQAFISNDHKAMTAMQGGETQVRKLVNDARVTRVGRFLRKSSLDELPQFWNVMKGDMSLVGPRPPIPYEVAMYEPWHRQRLWATPGMTGLWQVTARSSADFDEMVDLDLYYIEHQSFWLDCKILLQTPLVVFRGRGAG